MSQPWRLITTESADGVTNMAVDEVLLASVAAGGAPVLRFYGWSTPCLTLGFAQQAASVSLAACHKLGWDVVRRLTGGRAVLHQNELTYMLCAPVDHPAVSGGVLASYRRISHGLAAGLTQLGLELTSAPSDARAGNDGIACFDASSASEISFRGRKLLGSAQTRRQGVVLQHGSLPLAGDVGAIVHGLCLDEPASTTLKQYLRQHATTLAYALGRIPDPQTVIHALKSGLTSALQIDYIIDSLTIEEQASTVELSIGKYSSSSWLERK